MVRFIFVAGLCLFSMLIAPVAGAMERVALVIGNSAYTQVSALRNPKNDATALSASLENLGFKVVRGIDLDRRGFISKIREFSKVSAGADVALFFYAGHGLQVGGSNFLVPVDAVIADETDLSFEAIELSSVLKVMEREDRINLVFLDACRDNPMTRGLSRSMGTRSSRVGRGLAPIESGSGTLIGFATQPGNVALDGDNSFNSPFTTALLKHINTPNLDVAQLMRRIRVDVKAATNGRQIPWTNESLTSDFSFRSIVVQPKTGTDIFSPPVVTQPGTSGSAADTLTELAFWNEVKNSNDVELLQEYLNQYPGGRFVFIAKRKIKKLEATGIASLPGHRPQVPQQPAPDKASILNVVMQKCDFEAAQGFNNDNPSHITGVDFQNLPAKLAITFCEVALKQEPRNLRARFQLARAHDKAGDLRRANRYYRSAANSGYAAAQNAMGSAFDRGRGVAPNLTWAFSWYRKAAEQGHAIAAFKMGNALAIGRGIAEDQQEAVFWYRKSANEGYSDAQYRLALMLEYGTGTDTNPAEAAEWYYRALESKTKMSLLVVRRRWKPETLQVMQNLLSRNGLYSGPINGDLNVETTTAMKILCACG
ncbi:MAG: caspase family protein [Cohaesibacteraceae bacterium]|nr:caspase family protein [Cohaesibacteraceae bacterium]